MNVVLALGSNLGNRRVNLKNALRALTASSNAPLRNTVLSSVYESEALLSENSPPEWNKPYLNAAIRAVTDLEPIELLREIKKIESQLGRTSSDRWAPRVIDIDILITDTKVIKSDILTIPHSEIRHRDFVLAPLLEVCNDSQIQWNVEADFFDKISLNSRDFNNALKKYPAHEFEPEIPEIMGILNVTPDSFSDGNSDGDFQSFFRKAMTLIDDGADILDIGAESTRPGAQTISPEEEIQRLVPVLKLIRNSKNGRAVKISIDSRNPETLVKALEFGVDYINDVMGFRNPEMLKLASKIDQKLIFMHSLSVPVVRGETLSHDVDVVEVMRKWCIEKIKIFEDHGISKDRLIFDPGIGFGKSPEQSWNILSRLEQFRDLGVEILVGHSRKSFLNLITDAPFSDRDPETLSISLEIRNFVDILRVHAVKEHKNAFCALELLGPPKFGKIEKSNEKYQCH